MSSQSKTVQYLCKEEADLRFSFVNISNESKQLFLLRSFHSHPRFGRLPFPLCDSQKKNLSRINKSKSINRLKYTTHNSHLSLLFPLYFINFPKINIIMHPRKIPQSFSEREWKFGLSSFIRGTKRAKIFPIDRQINLKTRERAWCLARLMLRLPTRAPASRAWNANPSRKGSRLSASSASTRVPPDTCVRPRWPVVTARPAYAIKIAGQNGVLRFAGRAIKGNVYFCHDSCGLHVLLPILGRISRWAYIDLRWVYGNV